MTLEASSPMVDSTESSKKITLRAIVIDDDPVQRLILQRLLMRAGWEAESADSVANAWGLLQERHFHLALIDYRLPDGTGAELAADLRALDGPNQDIYVAGMSIVDVRRECVEAGMDEFFPKPIDTENLRQRLNDLATVLGGENEGDSEQTRVRLGEVRQHQSRLQAAIDRLRKAAGRS